MKTSYTNNHGLSMFFDEHAADIYYQDISVHIRKGDQPMTTTGVVLRKSTEMQAFIFDELRTVIRMIQESTRKSNAKTAILNILGLTVLP